VSTTAGGRVHRSPTGANTAVALHGPDGSPFTKQRGWRARSLGRHENRFARFPTFRATSALAEFFGLLGENGAGKTTLFKILATLVIPDAGTATVTGFDILQSPNRVREVLAPVIADERSLHWRLSARENMRLFASLHGLRGAEASRRIDELLTLVNLVEAADRLVNGFSSGMKQRLLVARALLAQPAFCLDEPTRSLGPISARSFGDSFARTSRWLGMHGPARDA
jgi:ABC-2 type transport system ATP-binding protein